MVVNYNRDKQKTSKNMIETCGISSSGFLTQAPNDVSNGQRHGESTGTSSFHWTLQ